MTIHDASGRDHRNIEFAHQHLRQRYRAELRILAVRIENSTMTARLEALRHHRMNARRRDQSRFMKTRGGGEEDDARLAQRLDPFAARQAEVKADDARFDREQSAQHVLVFEKARIRFGNVRRRRRFERAELGPQTFEPSLLARRIAFAPGDDKRD